MRNFVTVGLINGMNVTETGSFIRVFQFFFVFFWRGGGGGLHTYVISYIHLFSSFFSNFHFVGVWMGFRDWRLMT